MATLINSNKTNVVFVNNGVTFNSIEVPGQTLTECVAHQWVEDGQPWHMILSHLQ